jgi:putative membrane protein
MTGPTEPRKPRVFDADDPALVTEPDPMAGTGNEPGASPMAHAPVVRPTLAEIGQRGMRWGALMVSALTGAAALGATAWFARLVSAALAREDWVGTVTLALLLIAAFAGLMIVLREIVGFTGLARLGRLKRDVAAALRDRDSKRERKAAQRLAALYGTQVELAWSIRRFREHARDIRSPGELLALADREIMVPLDLAARRLITRSAKRVATVTAMSPMVLIAVAYVLIENLRLLRALASVYGGRPGFLGVLKLARLVFLHILATGGVALTDDLLGQFLGQDLLRRLSRRLGEGAFNGALTARVGVTAVEVIRPLPFLTSKALRVRDVLAESLKPIVASPKTPAR